MIAIVLSSISAVLAAIVVFIIVYYAIETRRQGFKIFWQKLEYFSSVISVDEEKVSFRPRGKDISNGQLDNIGLVGRTGSLALSGPYTIEDGIITRQILSRNGFLEKGTWVRTSLFVHEENPKANLDLNYHDVSFESELGTLTGWHIPEDTNHWIIGIHGHRSYRTETMRFVPTFQKCGLNVLLSDYRNDENAPIDKGGYHMFGLTEWPDLESAVNFCKANGAEKIFLMGHSMGGAILMKYLLESPTASIISGAILESPALDLNKIIEMKAAEIPLLPRGAEYPVKKLVSRMVGLRWEDLNYLKRTEELSTPMLLIHSQADETVPVSLSDQLATQRPDIVTYLRLENALHAAAWNTDKEVVESSIGTFISQNINN
ncbi:MAG: alpha/beta fold hydrolase [Chloroflexota bacterium]|nr:alpha/beta fold hydrolase [Chloroflexota bacterium]